MEYTGLKGLVFNNETKEIFGYDPVKENENQKAEVLGVFNPSSKSEEEKKSEKDGNDEKVAQQITVVKETVSKETIMQMVKEALAQEQRGGSSASASSSSSSSSVVSGGGSPSFFVVGKFIRLLFVRNGFVQSIFRIFFSNFIKFVKFRSKLV